MAQKKIGLFCGVVRREEDSPLGDCYSFAMRYIDPIVRAGGLPAGILPGGGRAQEKLLDLCDAYCILGGDRIKPYHMQAVQHAYTSGKKLLGICLGMQAMHSYLIAAEDAALCGETDILAHYERMKRARYMFTEQVSGHFVMPVKRGLENDAAHPVSVVRGSLLNKITMTESLRGVTLHNYRVTRPAKGVRVSACHADGTVEAIEYGEHMLGVQFHPEMNGMQCLFDWLCE